MSTLFSRAILRTSGEDLVRRRSSSEATSGSGVGVGSGCNVAPPPSAAGGGGGGGGGGSFAAGGGGATSLTASLVGSFAASPSTAILATTEFTGTVCPSCTRISVIVPAAGE